MSGLKLLAVFTAVVATFGSVSWGAEIGNTHCDLKYEVLKEAPRI